MGKKKKYADLLLDQIQLKSIGDDPPLDDIITDFSGWQHADYIIKRTLEDFNNYPKEAPKFYSSRGLPYLGIFEIFLNKKAKHQNRTFAPREEWEPTHAALDALHTLQDLIKDEPPRLFRRLC